jgi:hypothetical protein
LTAGTPYPPGGSPQDRLQLVAVKEIDPYDGELHIPPVEMSTRNGGRATTTPYAAHPSLPLATEASQGQAKWRRRRSMRKNAVTRSSIH